MSGSSDLSTVTFYGKDAEECDHFMGLVRVHAFKNDKADDDVWIAKQVYPCFRGKALRWYLKQPRDIRGDWELLQQALTQEWPLIEEESPIQPTPRAASPSTDFSISLEGREIHASAQRTGIIYIRHTSDPKFRGYLSRKLSDASDGFKDCLRGSFATTTDRQESLKVKLLPTQTPGVCRLDVKDVPEVEYLAVYFCGDFKNNVGTVIGVQRAPTGRTARDSYTTYTSTTPSFHGHIYHTDVWEIGDQGVMTCRWPVEGSGSIAIPFVLQEKGDLFLMTCFNSALHSSQGLQEAELVFVDEPF